MLERELCTSVATFNAQRVKRCSSVAPALRVMFVLRVWAEMKVISVVYNRSNK
jgi:hypothetical protein